MKENVREYGKKIIGELNKATKERDVYIKKINEGETLSKEELEQYQEVVLKIKRLEGEFEPFLKHSVLNNASKNLDNIYNGINIKNDEEIKLVKVLNEIQVKDEPIDLSESFSKEEIKNLDDTIINLKIELEELKDELTIAKKRNFYPEEILRDIEGVKNKISLAEKYLENTNSSDIKSEIKILSDTNKNDELRSQIYTKYSAMLADELGKVNNQLNNLVINEDKDEDKVNTNDNSNDFVDDYDYDVDVNDGYDSDTKEDNVLPGWTNTNEQPTVDDNIENEHSNDDGKKIATIAGTAILATALILAACKISKDIKNKKDLTNTSISQSTEYKPEENNIEVDNKETNDIVNDAFRNDKIQKLVKIGYNERKAGLMVDNFSDDTINDLLNTSYIAIVEDYATCKEFNLDYLDDYEVARGINNITCEDAVDYVNRSYLIQETNFYDDASIEDIVEIVMSIDKRDLFFDENASKAQSFNTSFNRITDNFLFGTITDEDIKKLDALQYFAKEGSDMDLFLTEFAELDKEAIKNPSNSENKDKLYNLLNIYATSLNGFTNDKNALTNDTEFNKKAQINDYYDFYMIYSSFVAPLYPTYNIYDGDTGLIEDKVYSMDFENDIDVADYYSKATDVIRAYNDSSNKFNSVVKGKFNDAEIRYLKYQTLQGTMISALQDPQFDMICGCNQGLVLGGGR